VKRIRSEGTRIGTACAATHGQAKFHDVWTFGKQATGSGEAAMRSKAVQYACQHGVGLGRSGGAARALGFQQREQAAWGTAAPRAMCWSSDGAVSATPGSVQGGDQLLGAEGAAGGGAGAGMRLISSSKQKYMQPMEGATCGGGGGCSRGRKRGMRTHTVLLSSQRNEACGWRACKLRGLPLAASRGPAASAGPQSETKRGWDGAGKGGAGAA
jgi:hypothetical protein